MKGISMNIYRPIFDRNTLEKTKISRRIALLGIAGAAGIIVAGCASQSDTQTNATPAPNSATQSAPAPNPTPVATTETTTTTVPAGQNILSYTGHWSPVSTTAWSPNGKFIASGENAGQVHIWNSASGALIQKYQGHNGAAVSTLAWSANGQYIASGSSAASGNAQVWEATTGQLVMKYAEHPEGVNMVAWSPDGTHIASAGNDGKIQVWEALTGKGSVSYSGNQGPVTSVAWSPDGKALVSSTDSDSEGPSVVHNIKIWDSTDGHTLSSNTNGTFALAWSPDGTSIVSGDTNIVHIWSATTTQDTLTYQISGGILLAAAWSPDGKHIATGSGSLQSMDPNSTVTVRELASGKMITYHGHKESIHAVAWSPDGTRIASASFDKTVQIWQAI